MTTDFTPTYEHPFDLYGERYATADENLRVKSYKLFRHRERERWWLALEISDSEGDVASPVIVTTWGDYGSSTFQTPRVTRLDLEGALEVRRIASERRLAHGYDLAVDFDVRRAVGEGKVSGAPELGISLADLFVHFPSEIRILGVLSAFNSLSIGVDAHLLSEIDPSISKGLAKELEKEAKRAEREARKGLSKETKKLVPSFASWQKGLEL